MTTKHGNPFPRLRICGHRCSLAGVLLLVVAIAWLSTIGPTAAQVKRDEPARPKMGESHDSRWQVGMVVKASGGACNDLTGYVAVPADWPEQQVAIIDEDISPEAKVSYEMVDGGVKTMNVRIPRLAAGQEVKALLTVRIIRSVIRPPANTDAYVLPDPKRLPPEIALYLTPSPKIESDAPKIRELAKTIGANQQKAWQKVEAINNWVWDHVKYKDGPLKGALAALDDGTGDCEERSALFIAICRAADVPARTIWVPDHCYSEFYLQDRQGTGRWFPCQSAGTREFGGVSEFAPILQKGDNFRPPKNGYERQRYMAEFLTGVPAPGGGKPQVKFIRQEVGQ